MPILSLNQFPRAIDHIDAHAFFASVEAGNGSRGARRPVVTAKERRIASSMKHTRPRPPELTRGMPRHEISAALPRVRISPRNLPAFSGKGKKTGKNSGACSRNATFDRDARGFMKHRHQHPFGGVTTEGEES